MVADSGSQDKMDALDLVINALKDHEKRLDSIVNRLEGVSDKTAPPTTGEGRRGPPAVERAPFVVCRDWGEFKGRCRDARIVTFETENNLFSVYAMVKGNVFRYLEPLPPKRLRVLEDQLHFSVDKDSLNNIDSLQLLVDGRLRCGFDLSIKSSRTDLSEKEFLFDLSYDLNPYRVKEFLSLELGVSKDEIVEGKITCGNSA